MENDDLFYKIRELVRNSDEGDQEWNPEKVWATVSAKKRKRQLSIWISYSAAAVLIFSIGFFVFLDSARIGRVKFSNDERYASGSSDLDTSRSTFSNIREKNGYSLSRPNTKAGNANSQISKITARKKSVKRKTKESTIFAQRSNHKVFASEVIVKVNIPALTEKDDSAPSLFQMYKQAKKERELRTLIVRLDDKENYNRFWLTVNQQLIANKFNDHTDLTHYSGYGSGTNTN